MDEVSTASIIGFEKALFIFYSIVD